MKRLLKYALYIDLFVLLLTGLFYAIPAYLDRWFFIGIDGPISNHTLMTLHGALAFLALYLFGYISRSHIQPRLRLKRHIYSGMLVLIGWLILSLSGYLLYYLGSEVLRLWSSDIHCLLGVLLPIALIGHRFHDVLARWGSSKASSF